MDTNDIIIKYVALYLRKSRGESEKDLIKHETELVDLCSKNNWTYIEYKEIESGDSIAMRPIMQQLLEDVESELFDAVCVVDIDRLGRGDLGDQDRIKKTFLKSQTLVVTPQYVYNLENENDEFSVDMRSFIARMEYKQIVKRLVKGKKIGARLGQWTNGRPPFPYEYERWKDKYNSKGLVVNDDKLKIYRFIIDAYLNEGLSTNLIAVELNKKGILSPRNSHWTNMTIGRLLVDETHLGNIISNKAIGDGHKRKKPSSKPYRRLSKDNWIVVNNCHEAVKTKEEHEKILLRMHSNTKYFPRQAIKQTYALSGLVKCGLCGHTMQIAYREDRKTKEIIKHCWYKNALGERCSNHGGNTIELYSAIEQALDQQINEIKTAMNSLDITVSINQLVVNLGIVKNQIKDKEKVINFIYDQYEQGIYNQQRFDERRVKAENELNESNQYLTLLENQLDHYNQETNQDKLNNYIKFRQFLQSDETSFEDKNKIYSAFVNKIIYTKKEEKDDPIIDVELI